MGKVADRYRQWGSICPRGSMGEKGLRGLETPRLSQLSQAQLRGPVRTPRSALALTSLFSMRSQTILLLKYWMGVQRMPSCTYSSWWRQRGQGWDQVSGQRCLCF